MYKYWIIFVIIAITFADISSQTLSNNYVAKVGNIEISQDEYLERYEFTPGFNRQIKNNTESNKIEFLFTLIAEKLWALEAEDRKLDTTAAIQFASKELEKMFVRDKLFTEEIKNKVIVTDDEINAGLIKKTAKLYVNFIFSDDYNEINALDSILETGVPFDTILVRRPERNEQKIPIEIVFGQMEENIENTLYGLKLNQYTKPILTQDGWYIFKLANRSDQILVDGIDSEDEIKMVKKTIEGRRLIDAQREFYTDFFDDKKVDVDPKIFEDIAQEISITFAYKKNALAISDTDLINLEANDISKIEKDFGGEKLNKIFIRFSENPISTKDYLNSLLFNGLNSKDFKINYIRALLDNRVRTDIEKELLYREGMKRGYNQLPEIKSEVEIWRDNYLFQLLKERFLDSVKVSDEEVYEYYNKINQLEAYPMLVNIVEILTDSVQNVEKILDEIKSGKDIKLIARKYNKRDWTKKKDGEYGLFPISQYGELGKLASTMNVGDIGGPIKLPEGYSIFKLIDKQEEKTISPQPFEKVKEQYRKELIYNKNYKKLSDYTYKLSIKFGVSLSLDKLQEIQVTTIPSFAVRNIGFGGQISAVPLLAPNFDWADEWIRNQQQQNVVP